MNYSIGSFFELRNYYIVPKKVKRSFFKASSFKFRKLVVIYWIYETGIIPNGFRLNNNQYILQKETSPLFCRRNHWTGLYMKGPLAVNVLKITKDNLNMNSSPEFCPCFWNFYHCLLSQRKQKSITGWNKGWVTYRFTYAMRHNNARGWG